ncbi:MAG: zinc ribbon domain-containing protein [Candidatus Gastranaerophilales bacterium]|nr:zinc ribbon domain-containing protein [Candidatus Gastranaerophilales bacterium]
MFCPNCGKQINGSPKFCENCGHKIEANEESSIYKNSYYKESYKKDSEKKPRKKQFSFGESFIMGFGAMLLLFLGLFGILLFRNYYSGDLLNLDKMKYQQYVENPSLIPELSQPETLDGLVDNLKNVQNFLALYLKVSDDDMETKMETFDKYRKELLKLQNFDNTNLLQANVQYQIPREEKEFKAIQKQYNKLLSQVGLKIVADDSYSKYRLMENNRFTYKKFGKYLPQDINSYLKLRAKYHENCMFKDTLTIKPYKLAERIGEYEKFMNSYKEFRYENEVKDMMFLYSFLYTFTSDRTNMEFIRHNTFVKSDKKFMKKYPNSELKTMFSHLSTSANGISENQFDEMYPYEYQKSLDAIKPEKAELADIFSTIRKNIMSLKSDANYQYVFVSETNSWITYDAAKQLKKGDMILAQSENGYDIYDYKYKKTNQTIKPEENAKFIIKSGQLLAYSPNHLQISSLDSMYGSFSFRTLPIKTIKKLFPEVLIINIDTFGDTSVQIDKPSGAKTYMLISTSGVNYDGYRLSGNITIGELSNIFTVSSDDETQVNWTSDSDGESYHIYFITQRPETPQAQSSEQTVSE